MAPVFDLARPFKTHHLIDPKAYAPSRHHRQEIRRSLRRCRVEEIRLTEHLATWSTLYAGLVERHGVSGQATFSKRYFQHLASLPELVTLAARVEGEIAAMSLWFAWDGVAYNHLGASSPAGYAAGASYTLYDAAVARFRDCRVLNLGGGAGLSDDPADGLSAFKRGFSSGTVEAWLYGRVLDPTRYAVLSAGRDTPFFPAYRG